jgi:hypothetical protein
VRRVRLVAAVAVLAASGCTSLPHADTVGALTRPAVTPDGAAAVVKRYNEIAASATSRRSDEAIASVQAGDLLRQTEAAYKISRFQKKPLARPAPFVPQSVAAPEYGSYPMHFVASGNHRIGLWERPSAGAPWRLTVTVPSTTTLPDLAGLREVPPTTASGLVESPSVAAAKFAELLGVGAKSPYTSLFTVTPDVVKVQKEVAAGQAELARDHGAGLISFTKTFTVNNQPAAFRTSSGDVLAFFTLTDAELMRVKYGGSWEAGFEANAFAIPNHVYDNALTSSTLHQVLVVVPRAKGGKISVVGFTSQLVDAGGY